MQIKKVIERNRNYYYWKSGDLHTHQGTLKEQDILSKEKVYSNTEKEFKVFPANFNDNISQLKRRTQGMIMKDISHILIQTAIDKNSVVLEAGSGSGILTSYLSKYSKHVYSYDIHPDNQEKAKENTKLMDLNNITFKIRDINKEIDEKDLDVIILDIPEATNLKLCYDALKQGGYLVSYNPNMTQVIDFIKKAEKIFHIEKVIDIMEMPWLITEEKARPLKKETLHTAFLTFCRRL